MEHLTPPPSKQFATKQDFQQTFTPSKQTGRSSHLQLFSPPGKSSAQSPKEENTLEIKSSQYLKSISCVKHDLTVAAHQFLFKKTPKDYVNKIWAVIEKNNILIEKQAIVVSAETSESFFDIMLKYFPEFTAGDGSPYKLCCMLVHFCAVNCISLSEVNNLLFILYLSGRGYYDDNINFQCSFPSVQLFPVHICRLTIISSTHFQLNTNFPYPFAYLQLNFQYPFPDLH